MSKLEEVSHEMLALLLPRLSSRGFSCGFAVSMREAAKPSLFVGFQAGCHVVLRVRRGTLRHSNHLFDAMLKTSKLEDVSHEMFVFLRPRVASRVSGFSCGLAVTMGKGAKPVHFKGFQAGCHVVLRGRRGTL